MEGLNPDAEIRSLTYIFESMEIYAEATAEFDWPVAYLEDLWERCPGRDLMRSMTCTAES